MRTDGAARGNPGPAAAGAVIEVRHERGGASRLAEISEALGITTNNVAEYVALVLALAEARRLGAAEVEVLLDSKLIVEQLHGRYRVRDQKLIPLHGEAMRLLRGFGRWSARHVPRAQNSAADALANAALDSGARPSERALRWVRAGLFERD